MERLKRQKGGKEVSVSGGLLRVWNPACVLCSGENMQVMVTYGDWDCDQNKGVHVGMLVA